MMGGTMPGALGAGCQRPLGHPSQTPLKVLHYLGTGVLNCVTPHFKQSRRSIQTLA